MKTAIDYLNDLKEKLGSDYKIAKAFNVDTAAISMIRKRKQMSDETALKIAEHLGIDPAEVLIAAAMARSEGAVKEAWENVGKKAGIAAGLIVGIGLASFVLGYSINDLDKLDYIYGLGISTVDNIHYAKSWMIDNRPCRHSLSLDHMDRYLRYANSEKRLLRSGSTRFCGKLARTALCSFRGRSFRTCYSRFPRERH